MDRLYDELIILIGADPIAWFKLKQVNHKYHNLLSNRLSMYPTFDYMYYFRTPFSEHRITDKCPIHASMIHEFIAKINSDTNIVLRAGSSYIIDDTLDEYYIINGLAEDVQYYKCDKMIEIRFSYSHVISRTAFVIWYASCNIKTNRIFEHVNCDPNECMIKKIMKYL